MDGITLLGWILGLSALYGSFRLACSLHADPLAGQVLPDGLEASDYED